MQCFVESFLIFKGFLLPCFDIIFQRSMKCKPFFTFSKNLLLPSFESVNAYLFAIKALIVHQALTPLIPAVRDLYDFYILQSKSLLDAWFAVKAWTLGRACPAKAIHPHKTKKSLRTFHFLMVTRTRFELVNDAVKGRCVKPLHQRAKKNGA